jgi:hypothetical protein
MVVTKNYKKDEKKGRCKFQEYKGGYSWLVVYNKPMHAVQDVLQSGGQELRK